MKNHPPDHDNLFVTIPRVTCKTPEQLLTSKGVRGVLEMFNFNPEISEPAVSPESLRSSFIDFERVKAYFERFKVQGSPRDIQRLMHLIDETGAQIKRVDTSYKLPEAEVRERFKKLGVDIEKQRQAWAFFYGKKGYGSALAEHDLVDENEPYILPFPEVCEAEMQALEEALRNPGTDIMFDDARLTPSETFNLFQRGKTKSDPVTSVRLVQALPVTPRMVQEYVQQKNDEGMATEDIDATTALQELHGRLLEDYNDNLHRGVRIVAYHPEAKVAYWGLGNGEKGIAHESERSDKSIEFMDIGTYMRVCKYLEAQGGSALGDFQHYNDHREQGYVPLNTMTANISPDGQVFAIEYKESSKRFSIKKIPAGQADPNLGDIVREVVQTKI